MKIAVESISDKKTHLEEDVPAKMWEIDSADTNFVDALHISCYCFKIGEEIVVEAQVTTQKEVICSRCLGLLRQEVTYDFKRSYAIKESGQHLDLNQDLREEILLNCPMKILCRPDCRGVCSGCGVNLNQKRCLCLK